MTLIDSSQPDKNDQKRLHKRRSFCGRLAKELFYWFSPSIPRVYFLLVPLKYIKCELLYNSLWTIRFIQIFPRTAFSTDALKHLFVSIALKTNAKQLKIDTMRKKWVTIVLTYHECIQRNYRNARSKKWRMKCWKNCGRWSSAYFWEFCRLYNLHFGGLFYLEKWLYL